MLISVLTTVDKDLKENQQLNLENTAVLIYNQANEKFKKVKDKI